MSCCGLDLLGVDEIGATDAPSLDDIRAGRGVVKKGMKGTAVEYVQAIVNVKADGDFGSGTQAAVETFQRAQGLPVDGVVGRQTIAALDKAAGGSGGVEKIDFSSPVAKATLDQVPAMRHPAGESAASAPASTSKRNTYIALVLAGLATGGVVFAVTR